MIHRSGYESGFSDKKSDAIRCNSFTLSDLRVRG